MALLLCSFGQPVLGLQEGVPALREEPPISQTEDVGPPDAVPPVEPGRETIAPWIVDVYGKNYQDFTNEGASRVISDWLTNALIDLDLFAIVNRERIRAVISERNLAMSGFARDISPDLPENELANAGKLLSVNFILLGNVKNLGATSEIDFKLLDVETASYSPLFRLNFEIPFNPSIEKFKPVVDRIVGQLAASFPVVARLLSAATPETIVIDQGQTSGLVEGLAAELWSTWGSYPAARGLITSVEPWSATVRLDEPLHVLNLADYEMRITVAPGPEMAVSTGRLELERGNYERARRTLERGLEEYPGHGRVLALHARACWQMGDYEAAVISYRDALKAEPNDLDLLDEATQVLFEGGHYQEVVELLSSDIRESLSLELRLGASLAVQGYPQQAREAYKRAFRLDPEAMEPHLRLAILAARRGELSEMERELRLARESDPSHLGAALADAIARGLAADPPGLAASRPLIEQAVDAGDFEALATAAELFAIKPSLWKEGLALAEKSVEINSDFLQGHIQRAEAYVLGEDVEAALAVLESSLQRQPNNVALLVRSGALLARKEEYGNAELRLLQAMDLAPLEWRAADTLGDSYSEQGNFLKAVEAYQRALEIAERSSAPDLTSRLLKLGRAAAMGGQHATGQPYLERCIDREPGNKECRFYLGLCYFVSNSDQSDEKAIISLKSSEGFSPDAYYYLGALHDRRELYLEARNWYQKCVDAECALAEDSLDRIDQIECIRGTIVGQSRGSKEVTVDVGSIHGVLPSQTATVVHQGRVIGRLHMEQVLAKTSVAKILGGKPQVGHSIHFRPRRPRNVEVVPAPKKGVLLTWQGSYDPGLSAYVVYRRSDQDADWREKKKVSARQSNYLDKSVKPGRTYRYRVKAVTDQKLESLISLEAQIQIAGRAKR